MARWFGMVPGSDKVVTVDLWIEDGSATVVREHAYRLQQGDRAGALSILFAELQNHVREHDVKGVVVKASAASQRAAPLAHFHSAEVRGVALAATATAGAKVHEVSIGVLSRSLIDRKVQDFLRDDNWWSERGLGGLKKGSREAAFLIVSCDAIPGGADGI